MSNLLQATSAGGGEPQVITNPEDSDYIAVAVSVPGIDGVQGVPIFLWGGPGSGKSSIARAALRAIGYEPISMDAGLYDPPDFSGTQRVSDKPYTEYKAHPKLFRAWNYGRKKYGLVIDDVTRAPQSVQGALMRLSLEREIPASIPDPARMAAERDLKRQMIKGEIDRTAYELALLDLEDPMPGDMSLAHVPIILTGNPVGKAGIWDLDPALANRMAHYSMRNDNATRFNRGENLAARVDPTQINARWDACYAIAKTLVNSFCEKDPQSAYEDPPEDPQGPEQQAYGTGRSWDMATNLLAGCYGAGVPEMPLVFGSVGPAAKAFASYSVNRDLPDLRKVFSGEFGMADWKKLVRDKPDAAVTTATAAGWAARTVEELRVILSASMNVREETKQPDLFAPALRLVMNRTQNPQDALFQKSGAQINDEIKETMKAIGMRRRIGGQERSA